MRTHVEIFYRVHKQKAAPLAEQPGAHQLFSKLAHESVTNFVGINQLA
ncbi:hypothetical protein Y043_6192 [Burkholderia pseudomallei MSHR2138]|nr:hypothetical protein Y043_6192 [Burkholderia pseudomallei MSHR2138]